MNRLSRAHERYRQTDGRAIAYSEREREFTFAKKRAYRGDPGREAELDWRNVMQ